MLHVSKNRNKTDTVAELRAHQSFKYHDKKYTLNQDSKKSAKWLSRTSTKMNVGSPQQVTFLSHLPNG